MVNLEIEIEDVNEQSKIVNDAFLVCSCFLLEKTSKLRIC